MQKIVLHEVAKLLQYDPEEVPLLADNDDSYKRYVRVLRSFDRMAWTQHDCWWCDKAINPGDWYDASVYTARPAVFREILGRKVSFWVEKRHYPECPDQLLDHEAEARREWDRRDQEKKKHIKKAA